MQQEIRFATFNAFNLAPAGTKLYDNLLPYTEEEFEAKIDWTARQIDLLDADVIGFQEIFSHAALKLALSRTRNYRDAFHVGFDLPTGAEPAGAERLAPSVALVSRLPLAEPGVAYALFPEGIAMPPGSRDADRFARPVVHAQVIVAPDVTVDVVVVHLKSKRPDYRTGDTGDDPQLYALACLRSLIRRGTEAVALRVLLSNLGRDNGRARVVLGDFNDVADAVTTGIVLGAGASADRLFDAYQLQRRQDHLRHVGFSSLHDGHYTTIDHILVSEQFNAVLPNAIGEVVDVVYLNDHLVLELPAASDHGQVLARIRLFDVADGLMDAGA
ncbi:endonuclease/exonuclease/phosphatase family protein [Massilia psychrophila]|uniref:Endonuclease/exonuclease/phosphatase n=1 Tax=Massilia psychrophila TaxID=1603353 RepID=A0A2G8T3B1_9BURK|nr:endonuclease/exonuclease/phosphatase family protein [Massilia psychrophila]PIL40489.1 endonuclease/exonuclease/phosphatase [Massilia psychrophila]GGE87839.1 nuclease [Massilia psychrophila]